MISLRGKGARITSTLAVGALLGAGIVGTAAAEPTTEPVEAGIHVPKIDGLREDFFMGADISTVISLENSGVTFYNAAGEPDDLFDVLAEGGVNSVRLRVWNDPFDADGNGYGGGNIDVARAVEIGERATAAGMSVLVNFHYSDFWSDPGKWKEPKAWAGLSVDDKADALYDYTKDALEQFKAADVNVAMVQVGNESNNGMAGVAASGDWTNIAKLYSAGSAAVREVLPEAKVALHFTNPERGTFPGYANTLAARGVDYDVFAASYYPFWHGTLANLTSTLSTVATAHDKEVIVTEFSWAYTMEDGDGHDNVVKSGSNVSAYPVSVQGQATALHDVIKATHNVADGAGLGIYYWEPAWLPVGPPSEIEANKLLWEEHGSGWAASYAGEFDATDAGVWFGGSAWDNQALFDFAGYPHESLNTFKYVRTGTISDRVPSRVQAVEVSFNIGDPVVLPSAVNVEYNDGTNEDQDVTWSDSVTWIRGAGVYQISGVTTVGVEVSAKVTVAPAAAGDNYVLNHSFEESTSNSATHWEFGDAIRIKSGDAIDGSLAVDLWFAENTNVVGRQVITGLPAGTYTLSASSHGTVGGPANALEIFATVGEDRHAATLDIINWQNYVHPVVGPFEVTEGQTVTVGYEGTLGGGSWVVIDDFQLRAVTQTPEEADKTALEAAVADAAALDTSAYTSASVAALRNALEIGQVVLAGAEATEQDVADATELITQAVAALVPVATEPPVTPEPPVKPGPEKPTAPAHNFAQIVPSADLTGDGFGDLLAVDNSGVLWLYPGKANGGFSKATRLGAGWTNRELFAPGDFNGDGVADVLSKTANGDLYFHAGKDGGQLSAAVRVGWGWGDLEIIPAGDVTGDGIADVLAIDPAGVLYFYAGNGNGGFTGKLTRNGQGWSNFSLYPAGDINGDGLADILSIDKSGKLFTHLGKGAGAFRTSYQSGQGWGGYELFAGADANGDGLADLYGRDASGKLFFYAGRPGGGFRTAVQVGTGW